MCEFAVSECPRPEKLAERASRVLGTRSLRRTPSLRSLVLPRCAQSPSFAALSLRCAQPVASPRHSLRSVSLSRLGREPREPVWSRSFLDGTHGRTERRGPKGPPPTHVCLVRETRLLPPKAGRLASRSAKPTLDGSSLIKMVPITSFAVFVGSDKGFDSNAGPRAVNIDAIEHGFNFVSPL